MCLQMWTGLTYNGAVAETVVLPVPGDIFRHEGTLHNRSNKRLWRLMYGAKFVFGLNRAFPVQAVASCR